MTLGTDFWLRVKIFLQKEELDQFPSSVLNTEYIVHSEKLLHYTDEELFGQGHFFRHETGQHSGGFISELIIFSETTEM